MGGVQPEAHGEVHDGYGDMLQPPELSTDLDIREELFNNLQAAKARVLLLGRQLAADRDTDIFNNADYLEAVTRVREADQAIMNFHGGLGTQ